VSDDDVLDAFDGEVLDLIIRAPSTRYVSIACSRC